MAVSGGNNSIAMVHLYKEGKSPRAHRKLRFDASLVFIDGNWNHQVYNIKKYLERISDSFFL